nr:MAG: RNA polymerase Rpb1, domain 5 [Bacteriophage sp.]
MRQIKARDLLNLTREELNHDEQFMLELEFDDGVMVTSWRTTLYSWYIWEFQRRYPKAPLLMHHHVGNRRFNKGTTNKTMNHCFWDTFSAYGGELHPEDLAKTVDDIRQQLFNDVEYVEEYVPTLDIDDFIGVLNHPKIKEINNAVQPNETSIQQAYKAITVVLKDEDELRDNELAEAIKSEFPKVGQALQCVGPRGYLTDMDSHRFDFPILTSYGNGIYTLAESLIESRSATKSLIFNKELIKETEYFNREMQLLCHVMAGLSGKDCGTTRTLPVRIRNKDDLKTYNGKYRVTDKGLAAIKSTDTELIGEIVRIRAVSCCEEKARGYVCPVCYGDLHLSVPYGSNIGHVAATEICREITQRVLSNKHLDQSSMIERISLSEYDAKFLAVHPCGSKLGLAQGIKPGSVRIQFSRKCAPYLADIRGMDEIPEHNLARYSHIDSVIMNIDRPGEVTLSVPITVAMGSRIGYFTSSFLKHMRAIGWSMTANGDYEVSLTGWDSKRPIFALPMKQMNMLDFKQEFEALIKRSKKYGTGRQSPDLNNPEVMAQEVQIMADLLNSKISTNVVHVEIMLQATMVISENDRDYRIPHPTEHREYGGFNNLIRFRSISGALAHEKQADTLNTMSSYLVTNRQPHPVYDPFLRV